jgi:hypothetical protein
VMCDYSAMLKDIQWPMVSAIVAIVAVIVALFFNWRNLKNTRLSNSARMVLDLVNIFNSPEMKKHRSQFARKLLENRSSIDLRRDTPVLEFFEEIGYMTKRKVLDIGMVWNSFAWWLKPYYLAVIDEPDLIQEARNRAGAQSLFREIGWLYEKTCEVSKKEQGILVPPSMEDIQEFLEAEKQLAG